MGGAPGGPPLCLFVVLPLFIVCFVTFQYLMSCIWSCYRVRLRVYRSVTHGPSNRSAKNTQPTGSPNTKQEYCIAYNNVCHSRTNTLELHIMSAELLAPS